MNPDLIYLSKQLQEAANLLSSSRSQLKTVWQAFDCIQRARHAMDRLIEAERAKDKETI